jgi:hypothetical protein
LKLPASGADSIAAGADTWVQLDRDTARDLDLKVGESVFLTPREVPGGLRPTSDIPLEEVGR